LAGLTCLTSVSAAALLGSAAPAAEPGFSNGTAAASAQSWKFNPTAGGLSVGFTFGQSLAGYTNQVAKADARGIDLGIIGSLLAAAGCDGGPPTLPSDQQPQPLQADSRDADAAAGKSASETVNKTPLPGVTMSVKATPAPLGQAETMYAPAGAPGVIQIHGAHSTAISQVVGGKTREAVATVDIASLDFAGGIVKIGGLHFQATHHTGAAKDHGGVFSMGSLVIAGQAIPTQNPAAAMAAVNTALGALGMQLRPPTIHDDGTRVSVDPLAIAIVPNATRDTLFGNVLGAALPVRAALTDALLKASCKFGDVISVADIAIGSVSGTGSFSLELGGVSATSGELTLSNALQAIPDLGSLGAGTAPALGDAGSPGAAGGGTTLGSTSSGATGLPTSAVGGTTGGSSVGGRRLVKPIAASTAGSRGGMLAAVAAAGFGLLVAAVEGDRRMMRRAQRMIPEA
ncbi:MAG: hypothetical protein JWP02_658, partial [Acidimicrobiales bacterium]|nr:hypothetical protein [Acidimicrobiales bacterium]